MDDLKRDVVKYVRDKAKKAYKKGPCCEICDSTERLDFHHFNSVTALLEKWLKENGIEVATESDIIRVRDEFIDTHHKEMYLETVTLCHNHHELLHKVYGLKPALHTAGKQANWVKKQREKHLAKHGIS